MCAGFEGKRRKLPVQGMGEGGFVDYIFTVRTKDIKHNKKIEILNFVSRGMKGEESRNFTKNMVIFAIHY